MGDVFADPLLACKSLSRPSCFEIVDNARWLRATQPKLGHVDVVVVVVVSVPSPTTSDDRAPRRIPTRIRMHVVHAKLAHNTRGPSTKTEPHGATRVGLLWRLLIVLAVSLAMIPSLSASNPEYDQ